MVVNVMNEKTIQLVEKLTTIPSPTGNTYEIIAFIENYLKQIGYEAKKQIKAV